MGNNYGVLKIGDTVRFTTWFEEVPDGLPTTKPQIIITRQGTSVLSSVDMSPGATDQDWYYDYTIQAGAADVAHQIRYEGTIGGILVVGGESYTVSTRKVDDIPTAAEIDVVLSGNHGAGPWGGAAGTGAYNATINVKDDVPTNVADAYVTIHNASDDDAPVLASGITDASGNVALLIDGNVYVRVKKSGFNSTSTAKNITASGTYNVTGTALTITPPVDPAVSTCYISVYGLDGSVVTAGVTLVIKKHNEITKDGSGNYATDTGITMTYDAGSETWQADIIKGTHVKITSTNVFGVDDNGALIAREFQVGTGSTTDLGSIRLA